MNEIISEDLEGCTVGRAIVKPGKGRLRVGISEVSGRPRDWLAVSSCCNAQLKVTYTKATSYPYKWKCGGCDVSLMVSSRCYSSWLNLDNPGHAFTTGAKPLNSWLGYFLGYKEEDIEVEWT
jgi:hypothetical protein